MHPGETLQNSMDLHLSQQSPQQQLVDKQLSELSEPSTVPCQQQDTDATRHSCNQATPSAAAAASVAPSTALSAGTAADGMQGMDSMRDPNPDSCSLQQEWVYMDCLSQLRDAIFADLPPPVAAEAPQLDRAAGLCFLVLLSSCPDMHSTGW